MDDSNPFWIETSYAGCRFRSRLEARWAVFFDRLGVGWEYEPQGFVIAGRPYLPDFRLTLPRGGHQWAEVKGNEARLDRDFMCQAGEKLNGLLILGPIPPQAVMDSCWVRAGKEQETYDGPPWLSRLSFGAAHADNKGRMWYDGGGVTPGEPSWLKPTPSYEWHSYGDRGSTGPAYDAARSARFEHGASG